MDLNPNYSKAFRQSSRSEGVTPRRHTGVPNPHASSTLNSKQQKHFDESFTHHSLLQCKRGANYEKTSEKTGNAASVTADTSGFTIQSNDGNFRLKIGADLQVDNRTFPGDGSAALLDTILLRRVRPTFSGSVYKYVDYFFRPDFGQGNTVIYDAYIELTYFSAAKLRAGKFKPPVGLERL